MKSIALSAIVAAACAAPALAVTLGSTIDFTSAGDLGGLVGGATYTNPGTGGVDGAADGFFTITRGTPGNFATRGQANDYKGDYNTAGVAGISLWFNDIGADQTFTMHLVIGSSTNIWSYTETFLPPENTWSEFFVDLTDESLWTPIGTGNTTLANALNNVDTFLIKHDSTPPTPPGGGPPQIAGELGLDKITFLPPPCVGDLDGDGLVGSGDLAALLGAWGTPAADLDNSGSTGSADLAILLGAWGPC